MRVLCPSRWLLIAKVVTYPSPSTSLPSPCPQPHLQGLQSLSNHWLCLSLESLYVKKTCPYFLHVLPSVLSQQPGRRQSVLWCPGALPQLPRAHGPAGSQQPLSRCKSWISPTLLQQEHWFESVSAALHASFLQFGKNAAIWRLQTYLVETRLSSKVSGRQWLTNR